ncbi:MAG TPA: hypothetical protein VHT70_01870 [Candidatus Saccharimonadales bacterium]|jgi:hypothetical protein|nr:hypothetical protein [Candidatus Saccharimonadales bacterium]
MYRRFVHPVTLVVFIGAVLVFAAGATVLALSISKSSGGDVEQHFITQTNATLVPTTSGWHDIPNTTFNITVPDSNTSHRLAHITFSGESRCENATRCSMRAVVIMAGSEGAFEMEPASGSNFTFDSGGTRGARSFSRIAELSGGGEGLKYTIKLQGQIIGGSSTSVFRLDDYLTQLELSNTKIF